MQLLIRYSFPVLLSFLLMFSACKPNANVQPMAPDGTELAMPGEDTLKKPVERKPGFTEDYINTDRGIWQKPELVINLLGTLDNKVIADIGAGTGFFTFRLVPKARKVIAIDVDPRFIEYLDSAKVRELPEELQRRIETRLAEPSDPHLAPGEADIALIVNTYMYIKNRVDYLRNLKRGLSEGGTLLIIDFKKKRMPIGPPSDLRLPIHVVEDELYEAGYENIQTNDTALDYQYIILAQK